MYFIPTIGSEWVQDHAARATWAHISKHFEKTEGLAFYLHPSLNAVVRTRPPELTVLARDFQPLVIRTLRYSIADLSAATDSQWQTSTGVAIENPALEIEDLAEELGNKFRSQRALREVLKAHPVVALPLINERDFQRKFPDFRWGVVHPMWMDSHADHDWPRTTLPLSETQWRIAQAIVQSVHPLNARTTSNFATGTAQPAATIGEALRELDKTIALLDEEQLTAAIPIAPGPQRIRGLAGTGKTVLLAMKAAQIHAHYPTRKILFTFYTQSLYNQVSNLIIKFYQAMAGTSAPDWNTLHIRHAWGGRSRPGVYFDLCERHGIPALNLKDAKSLNHEYPFLACCNHALALSLREEYDYILVDEAQDLPQPFFEVLWALSRPPHAICFAYDELQNMSRVALPAVEELFGRLADGTPRVSLDGEYDGPIRKDIVLLKSYRCPQSVLMLAHCVGLGIAAPSGPYQMLEDDSSWRAIGYEVEEGFLTPGSSVVLKRPPINSPNPIGTLFPSRPLVEVFQFDTVEDEIDWVASRIADDIQAQGVPPESIMGIWFEPQQAALKLSILQRKLYDRQIASTIPGISGDAMTFSESQRVTLTSPNRAKGNEASIVYVMGLELLNTYTDPVGNRNRAFAALSRARGWVVATGSGARMSAVADEFKLYLRAQPYVRFVYPTKEKLLRVLDANATNERRIQIRRAQESAQKLAELDPNALIDLDPAVIAKLRALLGSQK